MKTIDYSKIISTESRTRFTFFSTGALQRHLAEKGIYLNFAVDSFVVPDGSRIVAPMGQVVEPFSVFAARAILKAGFSSFFASEMSPTINFGRYCSIAANVRVMGPSHPLDRISTSSFTYRSVSNAQVKPVQQMATKNVTLIPFADKPEPLFGNDVWVGQDVLLGRGISIGDGAVVAGGSVVVKSVPPYAIVGGNPARLIRFRFSEELQNRLLKAGWWDYAFPDFGELPFDDPDRFLDEMATKIERELLTKYRPPKLDVYRLILEFYQLIPQDFDEATYISKYADVGLAIKAGRFVSGIHHFAKHGRIEGR